MITLRLATMLLLAFAAFLLSVPATVRAQAAAAEAVPNHPLLSDRFGFELGVYYPKSSTDASLGPSSGGVGASVDFEDTLGLEDRKLIGTAAFLWRMTERWRLEVEYFRLNRSATRTLGTQVDWGNDVFPAGSTVNSEYDFYDVRASVGYSFFRRPDKEVGAGVGVHVASIKAKLQSAGVGAESANVTAPLPVVSFYGAFALTSEWAVRARMDWLSLNYDVYSGDLRTTAIEVIYQPFRNVAFGAGLRSFFVDVDIDSSDWHGKARTTFTGPAAFMRASF
jgi:hypothetical protein